MFLVFAGMVLGILEGLMIMSVLSSVFRRSRAVLIASQADVNVFGGLVMPVPYDLRWRKEGGWILFVDGNLIRVLIVSEDLYIEGERIFSSRQSERYCRAVVSFCRRREFKRLSDKVDEVVGGG